MAVPKDRRLYDAIASEIKAKYKPSAYHGSKDEIQGSSGGSGRI